MGESQLLGFAADSSIKTVVAMATESSHLLIMGKTMSLRIRDPFDLLCEGSLPLCPKLAPSGLKMTFLVLYMFPFLRPCMTFYAPILCLFYPDSNNTNWVTYLSKKCGLSKTVTCLLISIVL